MRIILFFALLSCNGADGFNNPRVCQEACGEFGMASWTTEPSTEQPSCVCNPKCP